MSSTPSAHVLMSITALARGSPQLLQLLRAKFSPRAQLPDFLQPPFAVVILLQGEGYRMRWAWFIHRSLGVFVIQDQPKPTLRSWRMAQLGIAGWKKMFGEGRSAVVNASPRSYRVSVARLLLESLEKKNVCMLKQKVGQLCECVRLKNNQRCYRLICQAPLPTKSTVRVQSLCWNLPYWNMPLTLGHCDRMSKCTTTEQTKQLRKVLADERSPMQGFFIFFAESAGGLRTPHPDLPNIQQAAVMLRSNPSILQPRAFNKQRKRRITLSLPRRSCTRKKRKKRTPVI